MKFRGVGYLTKEGIKNIWTNKIMSIASIGVLVSCLILTGAAALISLNIENVINSIGDTNVTNVYLAEGVNDIESSYIGKQIQNVNNVSTVEFYSKEEAIFEYEEILGEEVFKNMQDDNPLPDTYKVTMSDMALYEQTIKEISGIEGVESISSRKEVADKLNKLNDLTFTLGVGFVVVLGLVSLFIISNAIRMSMYSRRFEISIMKSVGATDSFVRIPFVIEGTTIGLLSGAVSIGIVYFGYDQMVKVVQNIMPSIVPIEFSQIFLPVSIAFIVAGMVIGAIGSSLSMGKYLKKEGNELLGW